MVRSEVFRVIFELFGCNLVQFAKKKMAAAYAAMKPTKPGLEETQEPIHKIRITLSSKNVKNLEKGIPFCLVPLD